MLFRGVINDLQFEFAQDHKLCLVRAEESSAKTFLMKSLQQCSFNGFSYHYYGWKNYKDINWMAGILYNRTAVVCFDDADLYIHDIMRYIDLIKANLVIIAKSENIAAIQKKMRNGVLYQVSPRAGTFRLQACPRHCVYCGRELPSHMLTSDHLIPQSFCNEFLPGAALKEHHSNKVDACFSCNRDKSVDILIPNYFKSGWMRYMIPEQIGAYSDTFVELLAVKKEEVISWIYNKNMLSHGTRINYNVARKQIESDLEFFLKRYCERKPGEFWRLV